MEGLQLLSTVDPTRRLEDELDLHALQLEDEAKQGRHRQRPRRLSFALAVRKGRFARYSLLIGSRYGVWSSAERGFIKKTNLYHYHHITQGIRDMEDYYIGVLSDGFYDVRTMPGLLYKLLIVHPLRAARILPTMIFYYHVFMAKDCRMECWLDDVYGGDAGKDKEKLSSLRHRLVDVYRGRMTAAQTQRVLVTYQRDRWDIWCCLGLIYHYQRGRWDIWSCLCLIVAVLLVLYVIIA